MDHISTIRAGDLPLILAAVKLRRYTGGRTCQLCAMSEAPTIEVNCRDRRDMRQRMTDHALRLGISPARVMPMQRGEIGQLFERVQRNHGRLEVLKTWGVGIRALKAEPRYVLNPLNPPTAR